ncbi:hypothetical protein KY328_05075 [Candidatus Woesearchaeota archaeon]|nr:hypothetical protein [Candidatus Woesearchaeota archaeon]MBW3022271.1 hypothetical protein [Candidatus Woesearchaeota archaeon]
MGKKRVKKKLSSAQEFEVMKLVLNKLLWLGFIVALFGLYEWYKNGIAEGIFPLIVGIVILVVFAVVLVWEYEIIK